MACMARATVKDAPRAPNAGAGMLTGGGNGFFSSGVGFGVEGFDSGVLGFGSASSSVEDSLGEDGFCGSGAAAKNAGGGRVIKAGGSELTE
jgi:hypothetical protein